MKKNYRLIFFPFIFITALLGIWSGWLRIGWAMPLTQTAVQHGALMTGTFLGTLISLERAITFKNKWVLAVPLVSLLSGVGFLMGLPTGAYISLTLGSAGFAGILYYFVIKHQEYYFKVLLLGGICWLVGNLMLLFYHNYLLVVPWWIAFLLITITGERIELSRFLPVKKNVIKLLSVFIGIFLLGILMPFHSQGNVVTGAGMVAIGGWLLKNDMALKSLKKPGQHRYSAILLITGYVWLVVSGVLWILPVISGFHYDAVLHAFFLGFVFNMIFAHAPIIFPGVMQLPVKPYHPVLYLWAILLNASLLVRVIVDLTMDIGWRQWAGLLNGIIIIAFFVNIGIITFYQLRQNKSKQPHK